MSVCDTGLAPWRLSKVSVGVGSGAAAGTRVQGPALGFHSCVTLSKPQLSRASFFNQRGVLGGLDEEHENVLPTVRF